MTAHKPAPALDAVKAEAEVKALREAARDWMQGEWGGAPRRADRVAERIANAQHVGDWLRDRADHLARGSRTTDETEA